MATSSLPIFNSDSCPKATAEKAMQNVFVTQPEEARQRKKGIDSHISAVPRTCRIPEVGLIALKKTMVYRKKAELDEMDTLLALKQQQFKSYMEDLAHRRSELEQQQQQDKERVEKFERFVAENEVKWRRALKKCEAMQEMNVVKQKEIEDLTEQLKQLRIRKKRLKERMVKYKIFEDFLMQTLDFLPSIYCNNVNESLVMPIIWRHETLAITHQDLLQRLEHMETEVEQNQQQLQSMKQEHSMKKLMANKELSELQSELETLKERNKQDEVNLLMEQGVAREKVEKVGRLLMAINNLAQQCYLPAYGPLESMNTLTKLDMVKESILDNADTERRVKRLMGSASVSTAAVTDKRWRGSMKSIGNKMHIKSTSKNSETFN